MLVIVNVATYCERDLALFRKFTSITEQVKQTLTNLEEIGMDSADLLWEVNT